MVHTEDINRKHLLIAGQVQGVGYRYTMRQMAVELGLTGWCRNLRDGQVEAEIYGAANRVEALIAWCHQGPSGAEVTQVTAQNVTLKGDEVPDSFEIKR